MLTLTSAQAESSSAEMKEFLIISFLILVLLYAASAEDCVRVLTHQPISVDVNWCTQPVNALLPSPIGYCTNARCRSSQGMDYMPNQMTRGKQYSNIVSCSRVCTYTLCCCHTAKCRPQQSITREARVLALCAANGLTRAVNVRYKDVQSCQCVH